MKRELKGIQARAKGLDLHTSDTLGWGGTPKDRDEVNRREFWVCDGWVCDLEAIGAPSMFSLIRRAATLAGMCRTLSRVGGMMDFLFCHKIQCIHITFFCLFCSSFEKRKVLFLSTSSYVPGFRNWWKSAGSRGRGRDLWLWWGEADRSKEGICL